MGLTLKTQRTTEVAKILFMFGLILGLTLPLIRILTTAWEQQGAAYHSVWGLGYALGNTDMIFIIPVAVYFGLLSLVVVDHMKRIQGGLLAAGTLLGSLLLLFEGQLWQNVDWIGNLPILIGGALVGLGLGGGKRLYTETKPYEFPWAIRWLLIVIATALIIALVEIHVLYTNPVTSAANTFNLNLAEFAFEGLDSRGFVTNVVLSGGFLGVVYAFTSYEYNQSFMVLGPKRSGKTTLMTGAFHTANEITDGNAKASDKLIEYRAELLGSSTGFGTIDSPTLGGRMAEMHFNFVHGELLKKRVEVKAVDHGGELLTDLKRNMDILLGNSTTDSILQDEEEVEDNNFDSLDEQERTVAESVISADSLIITIPLDDFIPSDINIDFLPDYYSPERDLRGESYEYLREYDKILNSIQSNDNKDVIIVATMADLLVDAYVNEHRENDQPLVTEQDWLEFEAWISDDVLGHQIDRLLEFSDMDRVITVHFEMNPNTYAGTQDNPDPNPVLPGGYVNFVGGERLLRQLGDQ